MSLRPILVTLSLLLSLAAAATPAFAHRPPGLLECGDGVDNDGDGLVDGRDDGCRGDLDVSEDPTPQCQDRIDNDGDGRFDYPLDPDCRSREDDTERPTRCADGLDNDNDTRVDYPADPGCASAADDSEDSEPTQCADGVDNDNDTRVDYPADPGCTSSGDHTESPDPTPECADGLDNDGDGWTDYPADLGCADASDGTESPDPTTCADGWDNDGDGATDYPADVDCSSAEDDSEWPDPVECNDGLDNDGDGRVDAWEDPGCGSWDDTSESPDPACSDGVDNDGNNLTDYPADPGCSSMSDATEAPVVCGEPTGAFEDWENGTSGWTVEGAGAHVVEDGHSGCALRMDPAGGEWTALTRETNVSLGGVRTLSFLFMGESHYGDTDHAFRVRLDSGDYLHYQLTEGVSPNTGVGVLSSYGAEDRPFGAWTQTGVWYQAALVLDGGNGTFRGELRTPEGALLSASSWLALPAGAGAVTEMRFEAVAWSGFTAAFHLDTLKVS